MKILVIGGSGLLGSHTVVEGLRRGHAVSILSRGGARLLPELEGKVGSLQGDVHEMGDDALAKAISGHDCVVYSLGIDDRETQRRPAYDAFHTDHVTVCMKVLRVAQECGVKKFVVFGSYFTHFDRVCPELRLAEDHVYIKTRREQRDAILGAARPGFDTFVLELPYILGCLPGRVPPWTFLFSMLSAKGPWAFFFMKGGTAAVTASQVGQAAIGAMERGIGGRAYPIGGCNLKWTDFAKAYYAVTKEPKKLLGIPPALFRVFGAASAFALSLRGRERGLSIGRFAEFQYMDAFVDPEPSMSSLGYGHDDYPKALSDLIREWISIRSSIRK